MDYERSNFPRFRIHEKALPTTEIVSASRKLSCTRKRDQSLFSLLLEIESRLRTEGRIDRIEQRKRSKGKGRQRLSVNNLSRYCE
jgi:hypothetical protein